jgi:hypothetical protein
VKKIFFTAVLLCMGLLKSEGAILLFELNHAFSGTSPAGTAPWMTGTVDDSFGGPNTVRLTLHAGHLIGSEFVSGFYLNFNPLLDVSAFSFALIANPTDLTVGDISTGNNFFQADGDGRYDIFFDFPTMGGPGRFTQGETVIVDLTHTSPIDAASFNFDSLPSGGAGPFFAAAHVQSILGGSSGWISATTAVPEPQTILLVLGGAAGLLFHRARRSGSQPVFPNSH